MAGSGEFVRFVNEAPAREKPADSGSKSSGVKPLVYISCQKSRIRSGLFSDFLLSNFMSIKEENDYFLFFSQELHAAMTNTESIKNISVGQGTACKPASSPHSKAALAMQ